MVAMMWMGITFFAGIAEQRNMLDATSIANIQNLVQPTGTNFFETASAFVVNVWTYMVGFIKMVFLWYPTVWTGYWLWFYYIVCFPIAIGVVFGIVTIMRGFSIR